MVFIAGSFYLFKGRTEPALHFIKEGGAESIPEKSIVEVPYSTPVSVITVTPFGDQTMDVGVPLQVPSKSVEDHDITWREVL